MKESVTDWDGRRFVDDHEVLVCVEDREGLSSDWRLVAMNTMTDEVIVLDNRVQSRYFTIH